MAALVFCGCMQSQPPLPDKVSEAKAQVEKWIPAGTPMADAQHIMEQHGFKCEVTKNGQLGNLKGVDFISGNFESTGSIVHTTWHATLLVENDKVKSEDVAIWFTGP